MNCLRNNNTTSTSARDDIQKNESTVRNQRKTKCAAHFNNITKVTSIEFIQVNDEDLPELGAKRGEQLEMRLFVC